MPHVVLASALLLSGCSFAFVQGPPAQPAAAAPVTCTRSPVAPIVDTAIAVASAIGLVYFVTEGDRLGSGIEAALAVGFGASAITGWRRLARCERAQGAIMPGALPAGAPGGPPGAPP